MGSASALLRHTMKKVLAALVLTMFLFVTSCSNNTLYQNKVKKSLRDVFGATEMKQSEYLETYTSSRWFYRDCDNVYCCFDFTGNNVHPDILSWKPSGMDLQSYTAYNNYLTGDPSSPEDGPFGYLRVNMADFKSGRDAESFLCNNRLGPAPGDEVLEFKEDNDRYFVRASEDNGVLVTTCVMWHVEGDTFVEIIFEYSFDIDRSYVESVIELCDGLDVQHPEFATSVQ